MKKTTTTCSTPKMASSDYKYSDTVQPFKLAYAIRLVATKRFEVSTAR